MTRSDQRRRRVVIDEALGELEDTNDAKSVSVATLDRKKDEKSGAASPYDDRARRRGQPKTTDFLPVRTWSVVLFVLGLVLCVGLLNGIRVAAESMIPGGRIPAAIRLSGSEGLSAWFSTILLLASSMASLQIYSLRQHRRNDYGGTYRIWLLFAGLCLLASMNYIVDFSELVRWLQQRMWVNSQSSALFWTFAIKIVALSAIFVRGLIELRSSRSALTVVCMAWLLYVVSQVMQLPEVESRFVEDRDLFLGNAVLIGNTALFFGIVLYARYVFMAANQLLPVSVVRDKAENELKTGSKVGRRNRAKQDVDSEPETLAPRPRAKKKSPDEPEADLDEKPAKPTRVEAKSEPTVRTGGGPLSSRIRTPEVTKDSEEVESVDHEASTSARPLTKAERKRMKKLQRQAEQSRRAA